jgi:endonuclease/exonuclease/phosphatase family metal-dependent hydrolase
VFDPERTLAVLDELEPDVVGLQEIDTRRSRRHGVDVVETLRRGTGMRAVMGPTVQTEEGRYGNAILTRLPFHHVDHHDVSVPRREPRAILEAELDLRPGLLRVLVTHFGLSRKERQRQFGLLHELLHEDPDRSTLVLGDMNAWRPWSRELRQIDAMMGPTPRPGTFPSRAPILPLDRVWMTPRAALLRLEVHRSRVARHASDHLPLLAVVDV